MATATVVSVELSSTGSCLARAAFIDASPEKRWDPVTGALHHLLP